MKNGVLRTVLVFTGFTAYFFLLLFTLYPLLKCHFSWNSALYWFVTGFFLFIPLFLSAIWAVRREGAQAFSELLSGLGVRRLSRKEWYYALGGLGVVFLATGAIFGVSELLHHLWGIRKLSTTPWFMEMAPFRGAEKLLLLVWLPMFFFNICGEELLWRGYLQKRLPRKGLWWVCSLLWLGFHLPFGVDLLIMLVPVVVVIPFIFSRTGNTLTGIFIHGVYNGPIFVLVALGFIQ